MTSVYKLGSGTDILCKRRCHFCMSLPHATKCFNKLSLVVCKPAHMLRNEAELKANRINAVLESRSVSSTISAYFKGRRIFTRAISLFCKNVRQAEIYKISTLLRISKIKFHEIEGI